MTHRSTCTPTATVGWFAWDTEHSRPQSYGSGSSFQTVIVHGFSLGGPWHPVKMTGIMFTQTVLQVHKEYFDNLLKMFSLSQ